MKFPERWHVYRCGDDKLEKKLQNDAFGYIIKTYKYEINPSKLVKQNHISYKANGRIYHFLITEFQYWNLIRPILHMNLPINLNKEKFKLF